MLHPSSKAMPALARALQKTPEYDESTSEVESVPRLFLGKFLGPQSTEKSRKIYVGGCERPEAPMAPLDIVPLGGEDAGEGGEEEILEEP